MRLVCKRNCVRMQACMSTGMSMCTGVCQCVCISGNTGVLMCACVHCTSPHPRIPRQWDGPLQYQDEETGKLMMLPADMVGVGLLHLF